MPSALHCTVIDAAAVPRLNSATARVFVPDSVFDHTSRFVAGRRDPSALLAHRILIDGDHLAVRQRRLRRRAHAAQVVPGDERRRHDRPHAEVRAPLGVVEAVADLQHVGIVPVPRAGVRHRFAFLSMSRITDAQLALMSNPMRHMFAIVGRSIEQLFGGQSGPWSPGLML